MLWVLDVAWQRASEAEVAVLVGWLRSAANPQRQRRAGAVAPGSANLRTGKTALPSGYAPRTINHALSAVSGFYEYHGHHGCGQVLNPTVGDSSPVARHAISALIAAFVARILVPPGGG